METYEKLFNRAFPHHRDSEPSEPDFARGVTTSPLDDLRNPRETAAPTLIPPSARSTTRERAFGEPEECLSTDTLDVLEEIAADPSLGFDRKAQCSPEIIAVYKPFNYHGCAWGIYWNEPALLQWSAQTTLALRKSGHALSLATVQDFIRYFVRQHERMHFTVEYTLALEAIRLDDPFIYRAGARRSSVRTEEEILATAYAHVCLKRTRRRPDLAGASRQALKAHLDRTRYPAPYNRWHEAQTDWAAVATRHARGFTHDTGFERNYLHFAQIVPSEPNPRLIPEYRCGLGHPSLLRYAGISVLTAPSACSLEPTRGRKLRGVAA